MNFVIVVCCLFCAIFANPIAINVDLNSSELEKNSTEPLLFAQSFGNDTSEFQSSESESSESIESESSDNTSEESDSIESDEHTEMLIETRDDSMGSEENIRKSWVRVFATVVRDSSVEDNSTEVKGQLPEFLNKAAEKLPLQAPTVKSLKQSSNTIVSLLQKVKSISDSSSESAESTGLTLTATADSSQSMSSESNETSSSSSQASDSTSDSAQSSESDEDSNSRELNQLKNCGNGTQSCESDEYFFQDIGDDANYSVDNLMMLDEDDRELSLRR